MLFNQLIDHHPDISAVIGINDLVAIGAMKQAEESGYKVPEDISFIGIDGIELSALVAPPLTTFKSDAETLGKKAFQMLYDMIENDNITSYNHSLTLIERQSVTNKTNNN